MKLRRTLARNVIKRRNALGYTQEELADLAGIDRSWLSRLETTKSAVSVDIIEKVARGLGAAPNELLVD
ncbi:helix-turn-helix domain-containing protein [Phenylobacterium sp.]|jgi:transcriptional regulator with XRE-family HTH domain|uniref:helix-turn-helix domain-containing protein n=1 Tax=Phenylobacterium sp. TaxID=1871053 RepID=UPI00345D9DF2